MSAYIDATGRLIYEQERNLVLQCPHCDVTAHIAISAVPDFAQLQQYKPRAVGVVARCDACHAPIFLRFPVRMYRSNRIELSSQFTEIERPREKFTFTHLPTQIEQAVPRVAAVLLQRRLQRLRLHVPAHRTGRVRGPGRSRASCACLIS